MSAADPISGVPEEAGDPDMPRAYVASPLSNLSADRRHQVGMALQVIRSTVEAATVGDRADGDEWPIALYVPFDETPPWKEDGLGPAAIYERNYSQVLGSDALIVVADGTASAGIGQEIEWATRTGIPILYLSPQAASRQILGHPAHITCLAYGLDFDTLKAQTKNWLRTYRTRIESGPLRRHNRALAFAGLTQRLVTAWHAAGDPTSAAARCNLQPGFVDSVLTDPARVALLPVNTFALLCAELGVSTTVGQRQLSVRATRAWISAADTHGWDEATAERLRILGVAEQRQDPAVDLDTAAAWARLAHRYR